MIRRFILPPDDDPATAHTLETMRRLHDEERQYPDDLFVRRLERTLMTSTPATLAAPQGALDRAAGGLRLILPGRRSPLAWLNPAASIAIVAAVIAATLFLALRGVDPPPDRPATFGAFTSGTPTSAPEQLPEQEPGLLWQLPLPAGESLDWGGMEIRNGIIYRLLATPSFVGIEAVNALNGSVLWKRSTNWSQGGITADTRAANKALAADGDHAYLFSLPNELAAFDALTGQRVWSRTLLALGVTVVAGNDSLFVWDETASLLRIDPATGEVLWTTSALPAFDGQRVVGPFIGEDLVIVTGQDGSINALDIQSGDPLWRYSDDLDPLNLSIGESTLPDGRRAIVVQGFDATTRSDQPTRDYLIVTVDAVDGSILWRNVVPASVISNVAVDDGRVFAVISNDTPIATPVADGSNEDAPTNALQAYDLASGDILWTHDSGTSFYYALRTAANGTIIALRNDGHLVAISPETGEELCAPYRLPRSEMPIEVLSDDNLIFATLLDGTLIALDIFGETAGCDADL